MVITIAYLAAIPTSCSFHAVVLCKQKPN